MEKAPIDYFGVVVFRRVFAMDTHAEYNKGRQYLVYLYGREMGVLLDELRTDTGNPPPKRERKAATSIQGIPKRIKPKRTLKAAPVSPGEWIKEHTARSRLIRKGRGFYETIDGRFVIAAFITSSDIVVGPWTLTDNKLNASSNHKILRDAKKALASIIDDEMHADGWQTE